MSPLATPSSGVWAKPSLAIASGDPTCNTFGRSLEIIATAGTWPTADLAIYVPLRVKTRVVVTKLFAGDITASGNICLAVYDSAGTRLVTTGTIAAASPTSSDVTDTTIGPGLYYIACVADNTTITFSRDNDAAPVAAAAGYLTEQLGAGAALPATATWAVPQTLAYQPEVAILLGTIV